MSSKPVALILGSGPNLGASITSHLTSLGYLVATASRSGSNTKNYDGVLTLKADFTQPTSIPSLFSQVHSTFATYPSVVVWNAASMTAPPVSDSICSVPEEKFVSDLTVNTVSPYVAAQEAVKAWEKMGEEGGKKVYIYTGNILNQKILPFPLMLTLGVGKSASAHWLGLADATYKDKGYRFFYADQRTPEGGPMNNEVNGPAHGEFYAELVRGEREVPWLATFVQGRGYVKF